MSECFWCIRKLQCISYEVIPPETAAAGLFAVQASVLMIRSNTVSIRLLSNILTENSIFVPSTRLLSAGNICIFFALNCSMLRSHGQGCIRNTVCHGHWWAEEQQTKEDITSYAMDAMPVTIQMPFHPVCISGCSGRWRTPCPCRANTVVVWHPCWVRSCTLFERLYARTQD